MTGVFEYKREKPFANPINAGVVYEGKGGAIVFAHVSFWLVREGITFVGLVGNDLIPLTPVEFHQFRCEYSDWQTQQATRGPR